jgi:glycosyltransferase involved in cell wall biosynthesis
MHPLDGDMEKYRVGFVVEQALGHVTHGANLRVNVARDHSIDPCWILPDWETHGIAARVPIYNSNWTVRAGLRARRGLAAADRIARLDGLFFHTQVTAVLSPDWVRRRPSVVSLDATPLQYDSLGDYYGHPRGPAWLEQLKWRLNRDCFHQARHLVTWSAWTKRGLVDEYGVPSDKVTVISPGVNIKEWAPQAPRSAHNGPVRILFVGGNMARKGGDLLLDVLGDLQQLTFERGRPQDVELHLVTRDRVEARPGVFVYNDMTPNSPILKALFHRCDVFCLPTYGDALPMVLSEAAAATLPIVSTRLAAIPEVVQHGETGFLVAPGDRNALAAALSLLVGDPNLRMRQGMQGAALVRRFHDAEQNARRLTAVITRVIDEARQRRVANAA